jgi:hypothetical protein
MTKNSLSADCVVSGAGAVGLAFADTLLRESSADALTSTNCRNPPDQSM